MSQRRPKLPDLPGGQARQYTTKVVCDWRAPHPRAVLYHLMDTRGREDDGDVVLYAEGPINQASLTSWNPETEGESFVFHCNRCGRNLPLTQELLFMALDALAAQAGPSDRAHLVMDIALLEYVLSTRQPGVPARPRGTANPAT